MAIFFTAIPIVLNNAALPPALPAQPVIIQLTPQGVTIFAAAPAVRQPP